MRLTLPPLLLSLAATHGARSHDGSHRRLHCATRHCAAPPSPPQPFLGYSSMCLPSPPGAPCVHKPLLPHLTPLDAIAGLLCLLAAALAMSAGIGGGGIFVPALALLLRFPPHLATALSQALIFGGALGALFVNALARHPHDEARPLIDVGVAAFLAPAEMAGALGGVVMNQALPVLLILLAMTVLLSVVAVQTLRKGFGQWAAEQGVPPTRKLRQTLPRAREEDGERHSLILVDKSDGAQHAPEAADEAEACAPCAEQEMCALEDVPRAREAASPSKDDRRTFLHSLVAAAIGVLAAALTPRKGSVAAGAYASDITADVVSLVCVWFGLLALLLLRGGKGLHSAIGISVCGEAYWGMTALSFVLLLGFSARGGRRLVAKSRRQGSSGDEVHWETETAATAMAATVFAGVLAGMMGVGGGIVLGPLMIHIGMQPQVSTATTATMVLMTSSSAAAVFLLSGACPLDYSLFLGALTLVGGYGGKSLLLHLVRRYQCTALIVLILGSMIAVSMLAIMVTGIINLQEKLLAGADWRSLLAFQQLCPARGS
ncbi:hypothetical protein AB1Y20_018883 [Prymnesium parvum]|uniref:Membrane transporter protein n=1 Tax=Prymnesium parvum TaxID=97485 RepID=A0AB34JT22_PRYPA